MKKMLFCLLVALFSLTIGGCKKRTWQKVEMETKLTVDGKELKLNVTSQKTILEVEKLLKIQEFTAAKTTGNEKVDHHYYSMEIYSDKEIELIPWAIMDGDSYRLTNVMQIALDYQYKHKNKKDVAAINYSFYDIKRQQICKGQPSGYFRADGTNYKPTSLFNGLLFHNGFKDSLVKLNKDDIKTTGYTIAVLDGDKKVSETETLINQEGGKVFYRLPRNNSELMEKEFENFYVLDKNSTTLLYDKDNCYIDGVITEKVTEKRELKPYEVVLKLDGSDFINKRVKVKALLSYQNNLITDEVLSDYQHEILDDGKFVGNWEDKHPRTFIGKKKTGEIVFFVCEGRTKAYPGMKSSDMALVCKTFGLTDCYNFDGGGSSTMIVKDYSKEIDDFKLINSPSDGGMRGVSNALLVVIKK